MLAKYWKKIGLIILIIACLFNIINKLVHSTNLVEELKSSAAYITSHNQNNNEKNN